MAIELTPTPEAVLVEGAVGCGKTTRLVERAAALLEGGAAPSDLLVLAATPCGPHAGGASGGGLRAAVEATCVREVALGLLATEGGRAFSDRAGRLVTPVEMGFIMEDMKTCGLKNRRLKEMLKFFYRSWTELVEDADGNADWLLAGEEADVHGLLKGHPRFHRRHSGTRSCPPWPCATCWPTARRWPAPSGPTCSWTTTRCSPAPPNMWRTCWPATPSPWPPIPRPWWRSSIPTPMVRAWASSPRPTPIASASC